jgi:hypothetical protein
LFDSFLCAHKVSRAPNFSWHSFIACPAFFYHWVNKGWHSLCQNV